MRVGGLTKATWFRTDSKLIASNELMICRIELSFDRRFPSVIEI